MSALIVRMEARWLDHTRKRTAASSPRDETEGERFVGDRGTV